MREDLVDAIRTRTFGGVRPNHRGFPVGAVVCGFDFETAKGRPYALGFQRAGRPVQVYGVTSATALPRLLACLRSVMREHATPAVVAGAHYLRFDMGAAVYPCLKVWDGETARHGVLDHNGAALEYFFGRVVFGKLRVGKLSAMLIDTFRFFTMGLDRAAAAIGLDVRKLDHPPGFGERRIPLDEIRPYLVRDTEIVTQLLERILAWHRERDLYPSVSVAQLSMRVFRRKYVKTRWQKIPDGVQRASLLAYHAGRNGLYCAPGWRRVKLLDMNSAFPAAMRELPSFAEGRWERTFAPAGPWGFYLLGDGVVQQGRYPILFEHDFRPLADGPIRRPVWITGMELDAALGAGLVRGAQVFGYVWRPDSTERPLRDFVAENYAARKAARTSETKTFYKLLLNSLYGKFAARTDMSGPEAAAELHDDTLKTLPGFAAVQVAGGQFYPVAASWITALVRVWLWRMERKTGAYHSATDGLMVDAALPFRSSAALGGWKVEGEGWALILRNKFYLVFDDDGRLIKCAFHGFDGTAADVVRMLKTGAQSYRVDRLAGWLESAAGKRRPFVSETRAFSVSCSMRGFWPPPCKITIPSDGAWSRVVRADESDTVQHGTL